MLKISTGAIEIRKSELVEKLNQISDDTTVELLIIHGDKVCFADIDKVIEYGRDPTMKTVRVIGKKNYG